MRVQGPFRCRVRFPATVSPNAALEEQFLKILANHHVHRKVGLRGIWSTWRNGGFRDGEPTGDRFDGEVSQKRQELKAPEERRPRCWYGAICHGRKAWNGGASDFANFFRGERFV
jgi:hypothetical protein